MAAPKLGKKLAGLEEDAGGGGAGTGGRRHGGAGAAATRARRTCGSAAKKIRVPPGDKTPGCCIAFPSLFEGKGKNANGRNKTYISLTHSLSIQ